MGSVGVLVLSGQESRIRCRRLFLADLPIFGPWRSSSSSHDEFTVSLLLLVPVVLSAPLALGMRVDEDSEEENHFLRVDVPEKEAVEGLNGRNVLDRLPAIETARGKIGSDEEPEEEARENERLPPDLLKTRRNGDVEMLASPIDFLGVLDHPVADFWSFLGVVAPLLVKVT